MPSEEQRVQVNGEERPLPEGCTIQHLLEILGIGDRRVAVALNQDVIPQSGRAGVILKANDRIEILEAVGGG
ncbi:MAG: sulfur carrier protein ThiS [Myxococcota bacterium]|nr:sulfur carrier protein ThiS [Myxococcota bacterium]